MNPILAQEVQVQIQEDKAYFFQGKDTILCYQAEEKSLAGNYGRSNYIHPLYSLDGEILTEDFPSDHLHHRGIFWAWHQLYVGDKKIGDGWATENFHWDVKSMKPLEELGTAKGIQMEVHWKSPNWLDADGVAKAIVQEITTISVFPAKSKFRVIDIDISILAMESNVRLGGSEDEKGYGGFSTRVRLPQDIAFTSSDGPVHPQNLPLNAGTWMDISGSLGKDGSPAGLTIFCHPDNPGFPQPWILRSERSMQNAVFPHPGARAINVSMHEPIRLKYRLLVHSGDAKDLDFESIFDEYRQL